MIVFGDRFFKELIKLKWVIRAGPNAMTSVFLILFIFN